jgi:anion-transporting  ArsA/GET3 family ATPase
MHDLSSVIATHRVVVCVGSGGVGKTTTAASLALWGALQGRRTAVVTIDPAKRLADCLGLQLSTVGANRITPETFSRYGLSPTGTLTALLLDQQSAWDAAIEKYAPTPEIRERIFANRFYQGLSRTFAGSHEYMALDVLATLSQGDEYDLIVLDTPPAQQALDFLDAPLRLQRFLDSRMSQWLMRPAIERGWSAFSLANRTTSLLLRKVEEATGISALGEIAEFFSSLHGMLEHFASRSSRVSTLLASQETAFILVSSPDEEVLQEAENFRVKLASMAIALKGIVLNRVHWQRQDVTAKGLDARQLMKRLQSLFPSSMEKTHLQWMAENFVAYQERARSEAKRIKRFADKTFAAIPLVQIPTLQTAPVDLKGLTFLHPYLCSATQTSIS